MSKKFRATLNRLVETTANNNPRNSRKARNNPRSRHNPPYEGLFFNAPGDIIKYRAYLSTGQDQLFENVVYVHGDPTQTPFASAEEAFMKLIEVPVQRASVQASPQAATPAFTPVSPKRDLPPRPGMTPPRSIPGVTPVVRGVTPAVVGSAPQRTLTFQGAAATESSELMGSEFNPVTLRQYRKFQRLFLIPNFEAMSKQNIRAGQTTRTPGPLTHEWLFSKGYVNKERQFVRPFYNLELSILEVRRSPVKDTKYAQKRKEMLDVAVNQMLNQYAPLTSTSYGLRSTKDMSRFFQYMSEQPGVEGWGNLMIPVTLARRCPYCEGTRQDRNREPCQFCEGTGYMASPNQVLEVPGTIYFPQALGGVVGHTRWEPYAKQEEGPDGQPLARWHRDENAMIQAVNLAWDALVRYGFKPPEGAQWTDKELSAAERQKLSDMRRAASMTEEEETAAIQQEGTG